MIPLRNLASRVSAVFAVVLSLATFARAETPLQLPNGRVGSNYSFNFNAEGLIEPVRYNIDFVGRQPIGLALIGSWLKGVPMAADLGEFTAIVTATGALGEQSSPLTALLTILPAHRPLDISKLWLGQFTRDETISVPLIAEGGDGLVRWSIIHAPAKLNLTIECDSAGDCVLTGLAAVEGWHTVQLRAVDETGATREVTEPLVVKVPPPPPLRLCGSPPPTAYLEIPYYHELCAEGGRPPYHWQLEWSERTPARFNLAENGVVHGTPAQTGKHTLRGTLSDSDGERITIEDIGLQIEYRPQRGEVQIFPDVLPDARAGSDYRAEFLLWRNEGRWTWAPEQGLPDWATFERKGEYLQIAGRPTEPGRVRLTLRALAKDEILETDLPLYIAPPTMPLSIGQKRLPPLVAGQPIDLPLVGQGGEGAHRWVILSEVLPPGLTLPCVKGKCVLKGTTWSIGEFAFTAKLSDEIRELDPTDIRFRVLPPSSNPLRVCEEVPPEAMAGQAYFHRFCAFGGRGPFEWRLDWSNSAPEGLEFQSDGRLSGLPHEAGDFAARVVVSDLAIGGQEAHSDIQLQIVRPSYSIETQLVPQELPLAVACRPYEAKLFLVGQQGILPWSPTIERPDWITTKTEGPFIVLTGTPPHPGKWSLVVKDETLGSSTKIDRVEMTISAVEILSAVTCRDQLVDSGNLLNLSLKEDAAKVQSKLHERGFYRFRIDGLWGEISKQALMEFERAFGLEVDGIWGICDQNMLFGAFEEFPNESFPPI